MHSPTDITAVATEGGDFITQVVEIRLTTAVKTAKGVGGVKYGKWTAELTFGDEHKEISATDDHKTIHTRGAVQHRILGVVVQVHEGPRRRAAHREASL